MTQTFWVPGPLPGMNEFAGKKSGWRYRQSKANWTLIVSVAIKQAKLKPMKRVFITWEWRERSKRRDPSNFTGIGKKFIEDSLVKCGVLPNDGWDEILGWKDSWVVDTDKPGVWITLEER